MGANFKTFGNLKDIPTKELGDKEKMALEQYPNYNIVRTEDSYCLMGKIGARIYEITDLSDPTLPTIRRKLDSILYADAFSYIKALRLALDKAKKNFPRYKFEIVGEKSNKSPIYNITHFDNRLEPKITTSINNLSREKGPKDPFRIEYSKYIMLDKARGMFSDYIINIHDEDIGLTNGGAIRCVVEYPNNKYGLKPKIKLLFPLSRGEDPFYNELTILESLDLARVLNSNVEINLTNRLSGSKRICEVIGRNLATNEIEIRYETLNVLSKGINPFSKTMWDTNILQEGYFYVLECETSTNKIGIMYGISINPYSRIDSHLNYNNKINTKTKLIGLYKNGKNIDKESVLHLEGQVKKLIGSNFFTKEECSTNTETVDISKLSKLQHEIFRHKLIEEENEMLMEAINKLFIKKGLGDL